MSRCCRSTENYLVDKDAKQVQIKKYVGWCDDNTKYTFEIDQLLPNTKYELTITNFAKADGGNRTNPYTIQFTTPKK